MRIQDLEVNVSEGKIEIKHPKLPKPAVAELPKDQIALTQFLKRVAVNITTKLKLVSMDADSLADALIKLCIPEQEEEFNLFEPLEIIPTTTAEQQAVQTTIQTKPQIQEVTPQAETSVTEVRPPQPAAKVEAEKEKPLPEWVELLSDEQRTWIKKIAQINGMLEREYIESLTRRAEESQFPTHPINILFQDAWKHDLVQISREKRKLVVMAVPTGDPEVPIKEVKFLVPSSVNIELGECYSVEDAQIKGRCIALSPPVSASYYDGWGLPTYKRVEKIPDIESIPQPLECFEPVYLIELLNRAKKELKGIHECFVATVEDFRNPREDLYYLEVNDGTLDKRVVVSVGPLFSDNPWGITEKDIKESKGKTVLVYGFIIYEPPSKEWYREQLTVNPAFIAFA